MMTDQPENEQQESNPPAGAQNTEHMIPKNRFDSVISERNELRERLEALEKAQQQQQQQELEQQERYKELYQSTLEKLQAMETVQTQANRYQEALHATNEARLQRIPEDKRSLVPEYEDPVKLGAWLDANLAIITNPGKPTPPKLDGGSGSGGGSESSRGALSAETESIANIARQYGFEVNSSRVAEFARNPTQTRQIGDES